MKLKLIQRTLFWHLLGVGLGPALQVHGILLLRLLSLPAYNLSCPAGNLS